MTPFEAIGQTRGVESIVDRFYELIDNRPAYRELRALHKPDLNPTRQSLSGFLTAWLGGPRDWFQAHPGKCMMSVHDSIAINARTAAQWTQAMSEAMHDTGVDQALAERMEGAFKNMATAMVRE